MIQSVIESDLSEHRLRQASSVGDAMSWHHFVPASGPEGESWYRNFSESGAEEVMFYIEKALGMLRRGQAEEGKELLTECMAKKKALEGQHGPAITEPLEEGYWGAIGYWYYLQEDLDEARRCMDRARELVASTIDHLPSLLPFAIKCRHLYLNEARVARNQRRWQEMFELLDKALGIVRDQVAYCSTSQGPVFMSDLCEFFRSVEPVNEFEEQAIAIHLDTERTVAVFEHMALDASTIPWIAFDYS